MKELIIRLQGAKHPDVGLDWAIHKALGNNLVLIEGFPVWRHDGAQYPATADSVPRYTSSIDAALTLLPDGLSSAIKTYPDGRGACEVWRYITETFAEAYGGPEALRRANGTFDHQNVGGPTPAIALCIAVLKARAASKPTAAVGDRSTGDSGR